MARQVTVTSLVRNFGAACRALVPNLQAADIGWRDNEQYDPWERIAKSLFESFVLEPCQFAVWNKDPGKRVEFDSYGGMIEAPNAYIQAHFANVDGYSLHQLTSIDLPFDHCEVHTTSDTANVPILEAEFSLLVINGEHQPERYWSVTLDA